MANETKNTVPARRKLSAKTINLSKEKPGFEFSGIFKGLIKGQEFQTVDGKGEIVTKCMQFAVFENDQGERTMYTADKGLQDALLTALVKEGQKIVVVKAEKTNLSRARTMNQYDIFAG